MKDKYSEQRLSLLHPKAQPIFRAFIDECETTFNITLRIIQGYRTIAEQNALYAQGRTKDGKIVTNAKGGTSFHNYGLAIDLCEMINNDTEVDWTFDMATLNPIASKHGLEWGGLWHTITDKPHFQITFGYKWQSLLDMVHTGRVDKNNYVLI